MDEKQYTRGPLSLALHVELCSLQCLQALTLSESGPEISLPHGLVLPWPLVQFEREKLMLTDSRESQGHVLHRGTIFQ